MFWPEMSLANRLMSGAGSDALVGGAGDDTLDGGVGRDTLEGGTDADFLSGGIGDGDIATYQSSANAVTVSLDGREGQGGDAEGDRLSSIEYLIGSSGDDHLTGNAQNNALNGGAGDDMLVGTAGLDTLDGGAGDDTYIYAGVGSSLVIRDSGGSDRLRLTNVARNRLWISQENNRDLRIQVIGTSDSVLVQDFFSGAGTSPGRIESIELGTRALTERDVQRLVDIARNHISVGDPSFDPAAPSATSVPRDVENNDDYRSVWGLAPVAPTTMPGGGSGSVPGGGSQGPGEWVDLSLMISTSDRIGATGDNVPGSPGDDVIRGNGRANSLSGGDGADILGGGAGDDTLVGGAGADILIGGPGFDLASYAAETSPIVIELSGQPGGVTSGVVRRGDNLDFLDDILVDVEAIEGGSGADTLTGSANADLLRGGAGADSLEGNAGADTLIGGAGGDIYGYASGGEGTVIDDADGESGMGSGADSLFLRNGLTRDNLWLSQSGEDLQIQIIGRSEDILTIADYFGAGGSGRGAGVIETIVAGNHQLMDTGDSGGGVVALISAMASARMSYDPATATSQVIPTAVRDVIGEVAFNSAWGRRSS